MLSFDICLPEERGFRSWISVNIGLSVSRLESGKKGSRCESLTGVKKGFWMLCYGAFS
ncbi:hypothetical protein AAFF_G00230020 [Aldrovandia affinis]|uniref:Uncharacterized protein n=1 Tax=Aldrovandia affinis TaxID=143900 RepID=A0AAD7WU54_9TELE|nr:hypothetical protein AAFF_G00230020 [Aldrovandia affinis]